MQREDFRALQESHVGKEQLVMQQGEPGLSQGRDKQHLPEMSSHYQKSITEERLWGDLGSFFNTLVSHKGLVNILCIIKFYSGMNTSSREISALYGNCETRGKI